MHSKKIAFIFKQSPYQSSLSQSGIESLLAHASFECDCSVIYLDRGVTQLSPHQIPTQHSTVKNISKQITAFPLYNINNIYVSSEALAQYDICPQQLVVPALVSSAEQISKILHNSHHIYTY